MEDNDKVEDITWVRSSTKAIVMCDGNYYGTCMVREKMQSNVSRCSDKHGKSLIMSWAPFPGR